MHKRVFCFLLAAVLFCCPALAAEDAQESPNPTAHNISAACDSRFGSLLLDSPTGVTEDNIYFHVTVKKGYLPQNPKIVTASGKAVQCYVEGSADGVFDYYFMMPDEDVEISVGFTIENAPFDDVSIDDWFCDEVLAIHSAGLMNGTGERTFSPYGPADRAMLVTILWRVSGSPEPSSASSFTDVDSSAWYAKAVAWASENGIVDGCGGGLFRPSDPLTREQLAAILYRYAKFSGMDTGKTSELGGYSDSDKIGGWALDAVKWAVGSGIITGSGPDTLSPQGSATRAQTAVMLVRFGAV